MKPLPIPTNGCRCLIVLLIAIILPSMKSAVVATEESEGGRRGKVSSSYTPLPEADLRAGLQWEGRVKGSPSGVQLLPIKVEKQQQDEDKKEGEEEEERPTPLPLRVLTLGDSFTTCSGIRKTSTYVKAYLSYRRPLWRLLNGEVVANDDKERNNNNRSGDDDDHAGVVEAFKKDNNRKSSTTNSGLADCFNFVGRLKGCGDPLVDSTLKEAKDMPQLHDGVFGRTAVEIATIFAGPLALTYRPDVVILLAGINDLLRFDSSVEAVLAAHKEILQKLSPPQQATTTVSDPALDLATATTRKRRQRQRHILLCTLPGLAWHKKLPMKHKLGQVERKRKQLNAQLRQLVAGAAHDPPIRNAVYSSSSSSFPLSSNLKVHLVDLDDNDDDRAGLLFSPREMTYDGLHPNAKGEMVIARKIYGVLREVILLDEELHNYTDGDQQQNLKMLSERDRRGNYPSFERCLAAVQRYSSLKQNRSSRSVGRSHKIGGDENDLNAPPSAISKFGTQEGSTSDIHLPDRRDKVVHNKELNNRGEEAGGHIETNEQYHHQSQQQQHHPHPIIVKRGSGGSDFLLIGCACAGLVAIAYFGRVRRSKQ